MAMSIANAHHLSDFKAYAQQQEILPDTLYLKNKVDIHDEELIVCGSSFINKYFDMLRDSCIPVTMNDKECKIYRAQPKKFCYKYLGTPELWALLLRVNNMKSIHEFNKKTFLMPTSKTVEVIREITIMQKKKIDKNTADVYK